MDVTFEAIEAPSYNHAVNDKRKPTAYRVLHNGVEIGKVYSRSEESWGKSGRIRTIMRGYSRTWKAVLPNGESNKLHYTRESAVEWLIRNRL
jgi:hypothetical protein